ncbi:MAG: TrkH family potassium uptake protein [Pseudomonadota bacterium]
MVNARPVGYVIGLLVVALGATMVVPLLADVIAGSDHAWTFALSMLITLVSGGAIALSCAESRSTGLTIQQTFLLTTGVWGSLPVFGALPFVIGAPGVSFTDAFFEAMSGMTTTGSTVFSDLDTLPAGTLLWRGMLQWFGGIGIIVVAMAFLPQLKVGGMQLFRSESFDTFGKILPRAAEIAGSIAWIYLTLTALCFLGYSWAGLGLLDAGVHAMTTIATGGFSTYDTSFAGLGAGAEYVAVLFMILAALPFVRYVQLVAGTAEPLYRDSQIRAFLGLCAVVVLMLAVWQLIINASAPEPALRKALFNGVSILTGTGFASADYMTWGAFPVTLLFLVGLIGGCAGSTCCSIKVFRFQLLFAAVATQIRRLHSPHGVFAVRYEGRTVTDDVLNSVMAFFVLFVLSLGVFASLLGLMGLDAITAISGATTALANIGPGLGPEIGPAGNFAGLPDGAKWVLIFAMVTGRLELMAVYVLFTIGFWRR